MKRKHRLVARVFLLALLWPVKNVVDSERLNYTKVRWECCSTITVYVVAGFRSVISFQLTMEMNV